MAYTFEQVFAADPANPSNIAQNASITIFAPGDGTMTPIAITDPDGQPLANPIPVNANGFGSAFMADIDRVAWAGGGFTGFFTSYDGMKAEAVAARAAAETAAADAGAEAAAAVATIIADADAAASSAATAASNASASATSAATAASLVNAPADTAVQTLITNQASATRVALDTTFARVRSALYDDTAAAPNGTPAAFSSGQPLSLFGNAPLTISSGAYTHTTFAGANSAGYVQADMGPLTPDRDGIYHIGADVSWPTSDISAVALVLSDGEWTDTPVPVRSVAKVHGVFYGNVMHVSTFNAPGETKYMDTSVASSDPAYIPKYKDMRANAAFNPLDIQFNPATGDIVVIRPDGSVVTKNVPALVGFKPRYAIWELYEPNGTGIQSAKFKNLRASVGPRPVGGAIPTKADVGFLVAKAPVPSQLLKTTTQYRPATTETITTPTATAAEMLGTGGVQITRVSGVIPASGKYMVRIKGYLAPADARSIFWNLINTDTGATITSRRVVDGAEAVTSRWIDEEFYLTGDTPGVTRNVSFHHLAGGTGTPATGITAGQNPSRPVTVEFIPIN